MLLKPMAMNEQVLNIQNELRQLSNEKIAEHSQRFFKTGNGQYGEGDKFLGIRVPILRKLARKYRGISIGISTSIHTVFWYYNEIMKMHNPPHPGEIIKGLWLGPMGVSITQAAKAIGVSRKSLSNIINGRGSITPEMAIRLSIALGPSPESWMGHQVTYDLWLAEQHKKVLNAVPLTAA